ncbi:hypothetical protein P9268_16110, partial [Oceanobacillus caeni]|nr:hypothetical protein [Oceanobacillus caeni]
VSMKDQKRSVRKQRDVKKTVRMTEFLRQVTQPSIGVKQGKISLNTAHSSAIGQLIKSFS